MATIGTDMTSFTLNGRTIQRKEGRLTLEDGTLARAVDMISAVRFMHRVIGLDLGELRMASFTRRRRRGSMAYGRLRAGGRADMVHLSDALEVRNVWIGNQAT